MRDALLAQRGEQRFELGVARRGRGEDAGRPGAARATATRRARARATSRTVSPANARQQVLRRVERDDAARLQHRDAPAQRLGFLEVVRRQDDRVAVAIQLADERPQALPQLDVDARRGLVQHDHRRLVHQRLADQHAALHAARQRAHVGVGLRREVEVVQDLVDPRAVARACRNSRTGSRASRAREKNGSNTSSCGTTPSAAARSRGSRRRRRGRARARVPRSARVRPARIEISVVLPAPFGPSRPKNSPSLDGEVDAGQRLHAAEAAGDVVDFDGEHGISDAGIGGPDAADAAQATARQCAHGRAIPRRRRRRASAASAGGNATRSATACPSACGAPLEREQHGERRRIACAESGEVDDAVGRQRAASRDAPSTAAGVGERQRAAERPARAGRPPRSRCRSRRGAQSRRSLAGDALVLSASVLMRPSTPPVLICSLNSSR